MTQKFGVNDIYKLESLSYDKSRVTAGREALSGDVFMNETSCSSQVQLAFVECCSNKPDKKSQRVSEENVKMFFHDSDCSVELL